jgi:hypothetical protein
METTTLVLLGILLLALAGAGSVLLVRWRRQQRAKGEEFLHFRCPGCQRRLRYRARQAGNRGECSHCGHGITFPPGSRSID